MKCSQEINVTFQRNNTNYTEHQMEISINIDFRKQLSYKELAGLLDDPKVKDGCRNYAHDCTTMDVQSLTLYEEAKH